MKRLLLLVLLVPFLTGAGAKKTADTGPIPDCTGTELQGADATCVTDLAELNTALGSSIGAGADVTDVGDCTGGACLDGTAGGGSLIRIYDGDSNYGEINVGDAISVNVVYTLQGVLSDTTQTIPTLESANIWTGTQAYQNSLIVQDDKFFGWGDLLVYWSYFDEAGADQMLFETIETAAIATTDPMYQFLVGTTPTADQQVFGVAKGTQAANTDLLTLDEDGDMVIPGTFTASNSAHVTTIVELDTTATGANLTTLTDASDADSLHTHPAHNTLGSELASTTNDITSSTATTGVVTLASSTGQAENLLWNFGSEAGAVNVSSTTGVSQIDFGAIDLETTGNFLSHKFRQTFGSADGWLVDSQMRTANIYLTYVGNTLVRLRDALQEQQACFFDKISDDGTIRIKTEPTFNNHLWLDGVDLGSGGEVTHSGRPGAWLCVHAYIADHWIITKHSDGWYDSTGSPSTEFMSWPAITWDTDGTQCAAPTAIAIPSGGTSQMTGVLCTDNDAGQAFGSRFMPDEWDAGDVQFFLSTAHIVSEVKTCKYDVTCQCIGDGEAYTDTYTTEAAATEISIVTEAVAEQMQTAGQSSAITCTGTCAAGDMLRWELEVDATGTAAECATTHYLTNLKMEWNTDVGH